MRFKEEKPVPPGNEIRFCKMHWLREHRFGSADNGTIFVALQWNPGSKTWTHSNSEGEIDTSGFDYIQVIEYPHPLRGGE